MSDHRFFDSKVGLGALVSVAAMVSFNLFVFAQASDATPTHFSMVVSSVELA